MKKDKKIAEESTKKTNIIKDFKEIAHDIFSEEDRLLLKLEQLKVTPGDEEIDEVELIHDLRVNLRRLISLHYFYRPLLKKEEKKELIGALNLLLKSFGTQRTTHILQKSILKYIDTKKDEAGDKEEIKQILLTLMEESPEKDDIKSNEAKKITPDDSKFKSIYESVYLSLMESEENLFKIKKSAKIENLHHFKEERILELKKILMGKERKVDLSKVKEIHLLRIQGKNIFYTVNSFNEEFEGVYKEFLAHLQKIQDIAGKIHDADVNLSMMADLMKGKGKNSIVEDFMDFLESEKEEKILDFKEIIEEKIG